MISWRKSWQHTCSLCFSFSHSHMCSSGLNDICTVLILNFSCTFVLMSWIHITFLSGHLKIEIAWYKNFISFCRYESFLMFLNESSAVHTQVVLMPCFSANVKTVWSYCGIDSSLMNRCMWCKNSSHGLRQSSVM